MMCYEARRLQAAECMVHAFINARCDGHACMHARADAGFPLHGVVTRAQLLRLLKARIGLCGIDALQRPPPSKSRIPATQACLTLSC